MSSVLEAARPAALLLLGAMALVGCTETSKESYQIQIRGPAQDFQNAAKVSLLINNNEVASSATMGGAFNLETKDLDPAVTMTGVLAIRVVDAANNLLAFGQTPQLEFLNGSNNLTIFVQKPGTVAPGRNLPVAIRDHVGFGASTLASSDSQIRVTLPVFGLGRQRRIENGAFGNERLSNDLYVYNPFTHNAQNLVTVGNSLRAEAAGLAHPSGFVYLFGGLAQSTTIGVTSSLDVFQIARSNLTTFGSTQSLNFEGVPAARRQAVLAPADQVVVAVGGLNDQDVPLDTMVVLNTAAGVNNTVVVAPTRMSAARRGHTASPVRSPTAMVLVFGGAPAGGPVADLFNPLGMTPGLVPFRMGPETVPPAAGQTVSAGTGRRNHVALEIPLGPSAERKVLIFGGLDDSDRPRADSLVFDPATLSFSAGPLQLKTARSSFTAFVINNDLVVVGGLGADGKPIANAEIHDLSMTSMDKLPFVAEIPALPRSRATAGALSNLSVAILGGEAADGSSNAVEIYQPRR